MNSIICSYWNLSYMQYNMCYNMLHLTIYTQRWQSFSKGCLQCTHLDRNHLGPQRQRDKLLRDFAKTGGNQSIFWTLAFLLLSLHSQDLSSGHADPGEFMSSPLCNHPYILILYVLITQNKRYINISKTQQWPMTPNTHRLAFPHIHFVISPYDICILYFPFGYEL